MSVCPVFTSMDTEGVKAAASSVSTLITVKPVFPSHTLGRVTVSGKRCLSGAQCHMTDIQRLLLRASGCGAH